MCRSAKLCRRLPARSGPGWRAIRRCLISIIGLALGCVLTACSSEVAAGLDEQQSQEALAALSAAGIAGDREPTGEGKDRRYRIQVASGDVGRAAAVLRAGGLPRPVRKGFAQLYGSASMIPTPTEEKARYLDALGSEIAGHLERMPGVLQASVIVAAPEADPLTPPEAPRPHPTASVLIELRAGTTAPPAEDVRKLVAGSVEGLAPADVTVVQTVGPAPPAEQALFARIGPIRVARSSRGLLVGTLAASSALIIALGGWLFAITLRGSRRPS